jgi:allene oxide cyclase-like protein
VQFARVADDPASAASYRRRVIESKEKNMRLALVGVTLITTVACVVVVASALAAPSGPAAPMTTITFVGKATSFTHVDNPPKNVFGQGDYVVYTGIETGTPVGERRGTSTGQCVQSSKTGAKPTIVFCTSTISFSDGQIVVAGAVIDEAKRNVVPVIGGTGAYRGARGQAVERYIDDETSRWTLTFTTA